MIGIREIINSVDAKDMDEFGAFRENPGSGLNRTLNGFVVSKRSEKVYRIQVLMDTDTINSNTKGAYYCDCSEFMYRCAYVLYTKKALLHPNLFVLTPPKTTNPSREVKICKHIKVFLARKLASTLREVSVSTDEV